MTTKKVGISLPQNVIEEMRKLLHSRGTSISGWIRAKMQEELQENKIPVDAGYVEA